MKEDIDRFFCKGELNGRSITGDIDRNGTERNIYINSRTKTKKLKENIRISFSGPVR